MLRALLSRCLPYVALCFALGCGDEGADQQTHPTSDPVVGTVGQAVLGEDCDTDADCMNECEECTGPDGSKTCTAKAAGSSCTSGTNTDGACDLPDQCDGNGVCQDLFVTDDTVVCDPADGNNACDADDTCSGVDKTCEVNFASAGTTCGSADPGNPCDADDECDGAGVCEDLFNTDDTTVCNAASGACDADDTCSGVDKTCEVNFASAGTTCGSADPSNPCDADDECDGSGVCEDLVNTDTSTICQAANGACDPADTCTGVDKTCPAVFADTTVSCDSGTNTGAPCDAPDTCDGAGACVDRFVTDNTTVCAPANSANGCDAPDTCSGTNKNCITRNQPPGTSCTSATDNPLNPCDARDTCDANGLCVDRFVTSTAVICAAPGLDPVCDPADTCSGTSKACTQRFANTNTDCVSATDDPSNPCDIRDKCSGTGSCVDRIQGDTNTVCLAGNGVCDPDDHCTGINKLCPSTYASAVTPCTSATDDPANPCDARDRCDGAGTCTDRLATAGTVCADANGTCDPADTCTGTNKICTVNLASLGTSCSTPTDDTSNPCDARDTCDGAGTCTDNFVTDANTICRPAGTGANAACDPADHCTGTDKNCPVDVADEYTPCDTGNNNFALGCEADDTCNATGICVDRMAEAGVTCQVDPNPMGPAGDCDVDDICNGAIKTCPERFAPEGTVCDDGVDCTPAGTSKCLANGTCATGTLTDSLCPQPGDPLAACASWTCNPTQAPVAGAPVGCQINNLFPTTYACRLADPADLCDVTERCNNADPTCPADAVRPSGTSCREPSCSNATGTAVVAASCTGGKQCPAMATVSCGSYLCDEDGLECRTDCTTSAHCIASHYCNGGVCEPRVDPGSPCENDSQCSSSNPYCVDGVCCDTECEGQCQACNQDGSEGTCTVMPSGSQPEGDRPACKGDGSVCDGFCNGTDTENCEYPDTDTQCSDDACDPARNVATVGATCDGAGTCPGSEEVDCAPYACGGTECNGDCQADSDCVRGSVCRAGMCGPKLPDGDACTRASECGSGFCVDGVCCNSRCEGQCEACNVAGEQGSCSPVTGAPVGSRPDCAGTGDCAGTCDGTRRTACTYPNRETECQAAGCADGTATLLAVCNGKGACPAPAPIECPTGACEGDVCGGDECVLDGDCPNGEYCVAATCQPKLPPGGQCADDGDCASGYCTDGVCCDSACLGQCEACDVAGSEGSCSPVPAGEAPHGTRTACTSDGSACGGSCNGTNTEGCSYPVGDVCRPGSCDDGSSGAVALVEATCQGTGRCPGVEEQACGQYDCTGPDGQCDGPCANDPEACADGEYCSAGVCVPEKPPGEECGGADQCESGFCVDGVCCGTACGGQCEACDVAGSLGECTPVTGATHGGRPACEGAGPCGAECNGTSRGSCGFAEAGASCGSAFCSSGVASEGQVCDGAGRCTEGETERCLSYGCDGTACGAACATHAECTGENLCIDGTCVLNTMIDARDEGTCGCRVPGGAGPNRAALALLGLALGAAAIRRRRRGVSSASLQ